MIKYNINFIFATRNLYRGYFIQKRVPISSIKGQCLQQAISGGVPDICMKQSCTKADRKTGLARDAQSSVNFFWVHFV
jgi:hypothetical protein